MSRALGGSTEEAASQPSNPYEVYREPLAWIHVPGRCARASVKSNPRLTGALTTLAATVDGSPSCTSLLALPAQCTRPVSPQP